MYTLRNVHPEFSVSRTIYWLCMFMVLILATLHVAHLVVISNNRCVKHLHASR